MEQAEEALNDKLCLLKLRMRMYLVSHLNIGNVDQHEAKMKEREQVFEDIHLVSGKLINPLNQRNFLRPLTIVFVLAAVRCPTAPTDCSCVRADL